MADFYVAPAGALEWQHDDTWAPNSGGDAAELLDYPEAGDDAYADDESGGFGDNTTDDACDNFDTTGWTGSVQWTAGSLTVSGALTLAGGVINMNARSLSAGTLTLSGGTFQGSGAVGVTTLTYSSGTNSHTGEFTLAAGGSISWNRWYPGMIYSLVFAGAGTLTGPVYARSVTIGAGNLSQSGGSHGLIVSPIDDDFWTQGAGSVGNAYVQFSLAWPGASQSNTDAIDCSSVPVYVYGTGDTMTVTGQMSAASLLVRDSVNDATTTLKCDGGLSVTGNVTLGGTTTKQGKLDLSGTNTIGGNYDDAGSADVVQLEAGATLSITGTATSDVTTWTLGACSVSFGTLDMDGTALTGSGTITINTGCVCTGGTMTSSDFTGTFSIANGATSVSWNSEANALAHLSFAGTATLTGNVQCEKVTIGNGNITDTSAEALIVRPAANDFWSQGTGELVIEYVDIEMDASYSNTDGMDCSSCVNASYGLYISAEGANAYTLTVTGGVSASSLYLDSDNAGGTGGLAAAVTVTGDVTLGGTGKGSLTLTGESTVGGDIGSTVSGSTLAFGEQTLNLTGTLDGTDMTVTAGSAAAIVGGTVTNVDTGSVTSPIDASASTDGGGNDSSLVWFGEPASEGEVTSDIVADEFLPIINTGPWTANNDEDDAETAVSLKAAPGAGYCLFVDSVTVSPRGDDVRIVLEDSDGTNLVGPFSCEDGGNSFTKDFEHPLRLTENKGLSVLELFGGRAFTIYVEGHTGAAPVTVS